MTGPTSCTSCDGRAFLHRKDRHKINNLMHNTITEMHINQRNTTFGFYHIFC